MTRRLLLASRIALLAPLCVATVCVVLVALAERAGAAPFAGLVPRNSAEAAGWGRAADLLRFLRNGEDPRRVQPVRAEIISSAIPRATTLEASMWSRQLELIQLLDQAVTFDDQERAELACLAADLEIDDVVEYLAPDGIGYCEPGEALKRVIAHAGSS
jgi:hypothetical protein